jgi:hypothetical protein
MSRKSRQARAPRIEQLRQRIEQWRRTRPHLGRMPEPLWAAAVAAAREHGLYAASQGLRVSYDSLKTRMGTRRGRPAAAKPPAATTFVEIGTPLPFVSGTSGASVELTTGDGAKLAIRLAAGDKLDVVDLAREFWDRQA